MSQVRILPGAPEHTSSPSDTGAIAASGSLAVQEYRSLALLALAWSRSTLTHVPSVVGGVKGGRANDARTVRSHRPREKRTLPVRSRRDVSNSWGPPA
jgi:hypothetical protein